KHLELLDKAQIKNFSAGIKVSEETVTTDGNTIKFVVIESTERLTKDSYLKNLTWVFLPIPPKRGNKDNNTLFFQGVFSC
ncbi:hypothetical protein P9Z27_26365, partial [Bacillus cereus]|nr:hypothetical protein [Bacillus cereus]